MDSVKKLLIDEQADIRTALAQLERTARGLLLLVDGDGRLKRTVTDGDLRRLLLSGANLDDRLSDLPACEPKTISDDASPEAALELMNRHRVDHIPQIDEAGRPSGLLLRRDLCSPILLSTPHLGSGERGFVDDAFRTNWIAPLGPNVDAFETELAAHVGIGHAAALSSGTAAIHLALDLLGVGPGDEVFCSTLTFVATANPILYQRATPIFIDSEPGTWNMSVPALQRALADADRRGRLPAAVIVVNLYGQSADMDPILEVCGRHGVPVVEDAAESLGATYRGKASGTLGKIGIYSFNGNKIITTSGGGMLVSDDGELVERARFLSTQGREPAPWYLHKRVAYNYRMSNILAGVGRGQLQVLEERVAARRRVLDRYREALADIKGLGWMPEADFGRSTRWLSVCVLDPDATDVTPADFIAALARQNIEARHVWNPMHRQPLFAGCAYFPHEEGCSFSDQAFQTGVCLPSGSSLEDSQIDRVSSVIRDALVHR
ncbi:beta-eliminating lyase family protein [Methyloversatilis sp. RAC08]|uniref:aminotransferase class I/II-fold pyridoxal phosphate-dependent enzyme n=1 Tax=Methyloversatilis sp. RAC08 TaxID=1842540 RepID=UPI00083E168E|nr:aminotransferase class I/II-fold pyridoxal phosphate-dependent enzyme [Methyloversatilis sp. RAC08]AOF82666.1 beta-eliminating lyase family protein [Methyloversatilis sp. RAC08]